MDVSYLIDDLNDHQRAAVSAPEQNMLVLAGAGSGKTRVLTHRIAWLMQVENIPTYSILAVTFTNKAAKEMRGRITDICPQQIGGMWIGTFHGTAHRLLRLHYQEANLPEQFQIIDSDDQKKMVKRIIKSLNLDEKYYPAKELQWYINDKKDEGLRAKHIQVGYSQQEKQRLQVYQAYEEACQLAGLVDFAELLLRAHELLLNNPSLLLHYQQRFRHVLVDEFQDTNKLQYAWLNLLTENNSYLTIVGDDDQSIYGWRGADVENIQRFLREKDNPVTVCLEQNYRSTGHILNASNQLIKNNSDRLGKELWTSGEDGQPIAIYSAFNDYDETRYVTSQLKLWQNSGKKLAECAILYRSNAQSRLFEEQLMAQQIPYHIYGGQRFFDRLEIKDSIAYLRLINNHQDDAAFERIINKPKRKIGNTTLDKIRLCAREQGYTMWQASLFLIEQKQLSAGANISLSGFIELIKRFENETSELPLFQTVDHVIRHSGLHSMFENEKGEKSRSRIENLQELVSATKSFVIPPEEQEMSEVTAFLAYAALESGDNQADEFDDAVQLMTMHAAKGLEFPQVFMVGVEEGMFPGQQSADDEVRLAEERRLCYVGMTRAMQKLTLCHAESRRLYGQEKFHSPSRFISELPEQDIEYIRLKTQVRRVQQPTVKQPAFTRENQDISGFRIGQQVTHPKFGEGTVIAQEGSGENSRLQVNFMGVGSKWLMTAYARLETV
ncbi:UvrD/REP helicase [Psychromonas ingrahamii 37]|uniref:DNA 3'-5' helicase n=1 Tax=Psychromonas ingrahamii (strain DSM 17664 / CCUG 51855 / 37) TaxID=357804 RepID=A1SQW8_PSYIN|nr:DNA helicase II [Psychromonas ingrahamii]ABM01883.1 UvrD/REP helicase [Psychromonas ingrahamii 37]